MQAAEAWKAASEQDKAPHVAASEKEKAEYEKAAMVYQVWIAHQHSQAEAAVAQLTAPPPDLFQVHSLHSFFVPANIIHPDQN